MTDQHLPTEPTDVHAIVAEVWSSYLGTTDLRDADFDNLGDRPTVAGISVTGAWEAMIVIETTAEGARHFASVMLDLHDDALTPADVTDTVGELINIIGGGVKSLMPGPSTLSLPLVGEGTLAAPSGLLCTVTIDQFSGDQPFRVRVLQHPEPQA